MLRASLGSVCGGLKDEDDIYKIAHKYMFVQYESL